MNRSTFWMIKYMNGFIFFSKARYMNGVGFEMLARTPVPKLPLSYTILHMCKVSCGYLHWNSLQNPMILTTDRKGPDQTARSAFVQLIWDMTRRYIFAWWCSKKNFQNNCSETARPMFNKVRVESSVQDGLTIYSIGHASLVKISAIAIYGKNHYCIKKQCRTLLTAVH